jgi:hypothetical protein
MKKEILKTPAGAALSPAYNIYNDGKYALLIVKSLDSHYYRVSVNNGVYLLTQGAGGGVMQNVKYYTVAKNADLNVLLTKIIKRHNKATDYMTWWPKITL